MQTMNGCANNTPHCYTTDQLHLEHPWAQLQSQGHKVTLEPFVASSLQHRPCNPCYLVEVTRVFVDATRDSGAKGQQLCAEAAKPRGVHDRQGHAGLDGHTHFAEQRRHGRRQRAEQRDVELDLLQLALLEPADAAWRNNKLCWPGARDEVCGP